MSLIHKLVPLALVVLLGAATIASAADPQPPAADCRIVFLGDSITHSGQYIDFVDALLRLHNPQAKRELLNLGLPSETLSGLSEPGHAGGQFPRPDLHERLDRILEKTKPNLIVACYGMNDGIYYPPSDERLAKYQEGMAFCVPGRPPPTPACCTSRRRSSIRCRSKAKRRPRARPSIRSPIGEQDRRSVGSGYSKWPGVATG